VTAIQSAMPDCSAESISELYIEFDGKQLTVRTDVPEMCESFARAYSAMLVAAQTESLGRLDFLRTGTGYAVRGLRDKDYDAPLNYLFESVHGDVLFHFISSRQDLMWMHAGAVERAGKALLFAGPSGNGKSTLATMLCERGWRFLSDDIAPIRMNADEVLPFPQTPRRRIHSDQLLRPEEIGLIKRESVPIDANLIQRTATPIGGIVFPVFRADTAATLARIPPGDAALKLIRDCTNFADHKAAAVSRAVALARTIPVYGLTYSTGLDAAKLFDSLS
jgi:hypothetical protein